MNEFDSDKTNSLLKVDFASPFELLMSLKAFVSRSEHRVLELGAPWVKAVRAQLGSEVTLDLSARRGPRAGDFLDLLIHCQQGDRSIGGFLEWLMDLSAGQLYE